MDIAVLGSGPAGLMACHAASLQGHHVRVYSKGQRSPMGGAQYLHRRLPSVHGVRTAKLTYLKMGDKHGYATKVYGDPNAPTSWDHFLEGEHWAFSLRDAYGQLWQKYHHLVEQWEVHPVGVQHLCEEHDLVFCSIPAEALCLDWDAHTFNGQRVVLVPQGALRADNAVLYSGRLSETWYRTSCIFGHCWTEWAVDAVRDLDLTHAVRGVKPLDTNCTCHKNHGNFHRIGRFGQWKKGVLTHHAFEYVEEVLDALQ